MNREALFCDGTQDYVIPAEPKENEKIKIRFRTAHNDVEEVQYFDRQFVVSDVEDCFGRRIRFL